jgi:excinuclease ABC subunit C
MVSERVQAKLDALSVSPGVYVFLGEGGDTLYVGKAASLKSRVRSYFQHSTTDSRFFVERLQHEIADLETFVVQTEKEAALLENALIKEKKPRYNVKLRDDKEFLSLRLDPHARFARLEVVRRPSADGARYFGPYHSASAARSMLRVVNRHFRLRTCTDAEMAARVRPCLQFQIKRCPAPCVKDVDPAEYAEQVRGVSLFLEGRHDELASRLQTAMAESALALRYELAATYRDQLRAVADTQQSQRVSEVTDADQDVFGYFRVGEKVEIAVLLVRRGRVTTVRTFALREVKLPDDELMSSFVSEYYGRGSFVPDEVLVALPIEASAGLGELLSDQRAGAGLDAGNGQASALVGHARRVSLLHPQRGKKAQLLRMAMDNAAHAFREKARAVEDAQARLARIQQVLDLPRPPQRLECLDVSHLGGNHTVAVIVAFEHGVPDRKRYRSFHVRGVRAGDDYGAVHHVLSRRFRRAQSGEGGWELPDLLVVDGGKGQLAMAERALRELGITELPLAALAKEKASPLGHELVDRVYLPGRKNAIELREGGGAMQVLAHARDEAHRASNLLRVRTARKEQVGSGLDAVPGIGRKTRAILLKALGSLREVELADAEQLVSAGATRKQAEAIVAHFHGAQEVAAANGSDASEDLAIENAFGVEGETEPQSGDDAS